jgi:hypothetical protein
VPLLKLFVAGAFAAATGAAVADSTGAAAWSAVLLTAAGAAATPLGTRVGVLHLGHFTLRPAALSGAFNLVPHEPQVTGIGMEFPQR